MERKLRKISLEDDETQLARDLQTYQDKALELGATRVKIVRTDERTPLPHPLPRSHLKWT